MAGARQLPRCALPLRHRACPVTQVPVFSGSLCQLSLSFLGGQAYCRRQQQHLHSGTEVPGPLYLATNQIFIMTAMSIIPSPPTPLPGNGPLSPPPPPRCVQAPAEKPRACQCLEPAGSPPPRGSLHAACSVDRAFARPRPSCTFCTPRMADPVSAERPGLDPGFCAVPLTDSHATPIPPTLSLPFRGAAPSSWLPAFLAASCERDEHIGAAPESLASPQALCHEPNRVGADGNFT